MTIAKPRYGKYLLVLSGSVEAAPFLADWEPSKTAFERMPEIQGGRM
jgi:hypothetical protein